MAPAVPFVGLTGGIGAGKSEALSGLERLGAATLSSDAVVHELLGTDEVRSLLVERFGAEVAPNGAVDRTLVAKRAFAGEDDRRWLEEVLWPRVGERMWRWRQEVAQLDPPPRAAVVEVPLLFEAGVDDAFDATVVIIADEAVRAERAGGRGHEGVASRTARQLGQTEKAERADWIIRNDGTIEELERQLSQLLENIGP